MPGLSQGFVGGIGTPDAVTPSKYYSPSPGNTSIPVPILGWDNDGDYQVPNDYNNALYMINVAAYVLGDNVELPPPAPPATDVILMGWQGYYASKARMLEYDDRTIIPIIAAAVPVMDWTLDADNQLSDDYNSAYGMLNLAEYSLGDSPEAINYGQGVITGWDTDADMQLSNAFDYSIRQDPDDRVVRIFIPTQEIDNDAEQQFSTEVNKSSNQDSNDTTVQIFIPVMEIDNDAEQQILNPLWVSNIASDQGQDTTNFVITPFLADQYEVNQFSTNSNVAYSQYDVSQDWTQFIVVQVFNPALVPQIEDIQLSMQPQSLDMFDDRSNLIVLPSNIWDNDAGNQQSNQVQFSSDTVLDEGVEIIITPPVQPTMSSYSEDQYGMISTQITFQSDDQGNIESTNFIILVPFVNIVEGLGEAEDE